MISSGVSYGSFAQTATFEYDLKITADPAKRAAYLKQSGEAPSPYEQVFNLVKGSMQVATVVEKVDIRKDQYHINSIGTLGSILSQQYWRIRSYCVALLGLLARMGC